MKHLRNLFLAGLAVLLPLFVTVYVLAASFRLIDGIAQWGVLALLGRPVPGVGAAFFLLLVLLTGLIATNVLGKRIISFLDAIPYRLPLVKSIYGATRQVIDAFSFKTGAFLQVALVEYPRQGSYAIGFVTSDGLEETNRATGHDLVNLFLPTTPNPTSGFLLMVPRDEVTILDISVEEGLKMIISGGVVTPRINGSARKGSPGAS